MARHPIHLRPSPFRARHFRGPGIPRTKAEPKQPDQPSTPKPTTKQPPAPPENAQAAPGAANNPETTPSPALAQDAALESSLATPPQVPTVPATPSWEDRQSKPEEEEVREEKPQRQQAPDLTTEEGWGEVLFGKATDEKQLVELAAPLIGQQGLPDSQVVLNRITPYALTFGLVHPAISQCKRRIMIDGNNQPYIHNEYISLRQKGKALGPHIFLSQTQAAKQMGYYINLLGVSVTYPVGQEDFNMNGCRVWPIMGCDASLNRLPPALAKALHAHNRRAQTLLEVIDTPGGPRYWEWLMDQKVGYTESNGVWKLGMRLHFDPTNERAMRMARDHVKFRDWLLRQGHKALETTMDSEQFPEQPLYADPDTTNEELHRVIELMEAEQRKEQSNQKALTRGYTPGLYEAFDKAGDEEKPQELLQIPDVRQRNDFECGACAALMVSMFYRVGTDNLDKIGKILGTNRATSTHPFAIRDYLKSLGLQVEARDHMTLEDLADYWQRGWPVIIPVQEYGDPTKEGKHKEEPKEGEKPEFDYGHYLIFCGGPALGQIFVADPSIDNILEGEHADAAKGKMMIPILEFLKVWHDKDKDGNKFERYGIAVGPPLKEEKAIISTDTNDHLRPTPRSGGNLFGAGQVTDVMRPLWYGTGEGADAYEFDAPQHRVKDMGEHAHEFSSTQFNLADAGYSRSDGSPIPKIKEILDNIADDDLAIKGREQNPHITVLYAIGTDNTEAIQQAVNEWMKHRNGKSIRAKLGDIASFPANDSHLRSDEELNDVLYVEVDSPDLHDLHNFLLRKFGTLEEGN